MKMLDFRVYLAWHPLADIFVFMLCVTPPFVAGICLYEYISRGTSPIAFLRSFL